ncbi:MAG TPA: lipid-transfer protein [Caulobacteraceae bacterium]|jgi:acetyl-CoA acetyltransferase|nr:lipid-transfer protein [Caulobacteraceae bacterium]
MSLARTRAVVSGVGMAHFAKPSQSVPYPQMAAYAVREALADAGLEYGAVQQAYVGYVYGDSTAGQRALYEVGLSGIPIVNVNNNCATGSTALYLARQAIESGTADCVLALGFEQMPPGALSAAFSAWANPMERHLETMDAIQTRDENRPLAAEFFGGAAREYQSRFGAKTETFAKVAVKARRHAANNPRALFKTPVSVDEVLASPAIFEPLTRLQCCPPTCGAAAAVLCSPEFARRRGAGNEVVIAGQAMTTDVAGTFESRSMIQLVGSDLSRRAVRQASELAGLGVDDAQVVELHDCFTSNELISYEALGLAREGEAEQLVEDGDNTYGGRFVVNPSGGLLSKGHPLGATGLAQCAELVWQLRGEAEARQVDGAKVALQHNLGLGGACVVTFYQVA